MTTTRAFQSRPDSYRSQKECEDAVRRKKRQSNYRYRSFTQSHFTAGDEEQFQQYRDATNGDVCIAEIDIKDNLFIEQPFKTWDKYKDVQATAVINTFRYIFNKFKKGIFVKIKGNKVVVFLPFSKAHFVNEWANKIHINPKFKDLDSFLRHYTISHHRYNPRRVNKVFKEWYANNCILRYDIDPRTRQPNEGDTNVGTIKNMLETLCSKRIVPDIEFFINRRDFPILTRNGTEPYDNIWGDNVPLVSHSLSQYLPILSMSKTDKYADILVPTHEDWARVQSENGIWFPRSCRNYNEVFDTSWKEKKNTAVFRGASTGCGVTIKTNPRLKLAFIAANVEEKEGKEPLLDAGITKWNLRPRKIKGSPYLQSIDVAQLREKGIDLVNFMSLREQSKYKYIINVDGHVSAFRLSIELGMKSVILLVKSDWKIWYSDMLIPYKHYVPIRSDLSNLLDQIRWCRANDDKCQEIAKNAYEFFETYIQEKGILDYLQKTLIDLKDEVGVYLYNQQTPRDIQIEYELQSLTLTYPNTKKTTADIHEIPWLARRCYGLLQGVHWTINMALHEKDLKSAVYESRKLSQNKLGVVKQYVLGRRDSRAHFHLAIKTTEDPAKSKEHIHDAFVGIKAINGLIKYIPNFAYTFGLINEGKKVSVINEFIQGPTLFDYLKSRNFHFGEFLFIMAQVCLAIQVAQNKCGLVHYDLVPWNIILQWNPGSTMVDYVLSYDKVIRVKTHVIPIIIDYGKSHVIVDHQHHGFINMFHVSTIQDVLSLLVNSLVIIREKQQMNKVDFSSMMKLANFMSGTKYRKKPFNKAQDLREFLSHARKYSTMAYGSKYELEKRTPMDMYDWIMQLSQIARYRFIKNLSQVNDYTYSMDKGNGRQVFEYILSSNVEERAQSYFNVFSRLKHCTIPQPKNLFFVYYAVQVLYRNLESVREEMNAFLAATANSRPKSTLRKGDHRSRPSDLGDHRSRPSDLGDHRSRPSDLERMAASTYAEAYASSLEYLAKVYQPKIQKMKEEEIEYKVTGDFASLVPAPYTEESFLDPPKIYDLLKRKSSVQDLSTYRRIIEYILLDRGEYRLQSKVREHYIRNFKNLLSINPLNMQNNTANQVTLSSLASKIYIEDQEMLEKSLPGKGDCTSAQGYLKQYIAILKLLGV